jgi:hypothetical protein
MRTTPPLRFKSTYFRRWRNLSGLLFGRGHSAGSRPHRQRERWSADRSGWFAVMRSCGDEEGLSWRAIGTKLGIPAMTALDSYRRSAPATCTETVVSEAAVSGGKRKEKTVAV